MVFAMPTARIAVMGPAGVEFVYKDELRGDRGGVPQGAGRRRAAGAGRRQARRGPGRADRSATSRELMNPKEALSLGSVSRIVMPGTSRRVLAENLNFLMRTYTPSPMSGPQREFE